MKFFLSNLTSYLNNYKINFFFFSLLIILITNLNLNIDLLELSNINFFSSENEIASNSVDTEILARRIGSGLATSGLGGVGVGIGLVFSGLIKGFSRNPSLKDELFSYAIFGFALTEAIGLFALMMAFMLLYA